MNYVPDYPSAFIVYNNKIVDLVEGRRAIAHIAHGLCEHSCRYWHQEWKLISLM